MKMKKSDLINQHDEECVKLNMEAKMIIWDFALHYLLDVQNENRDKIVYQMASFCWDVLCLILEDAFYLPL